VTAGIGRRQDRNAGGTRLAADDGSAVMKIVRFTGPDDAPPSPGVLVDDEIVDIGPLLAPHRPRDPHDTMRRLITHFDALHDDIERLMRTSRPLALEAARLLAPLPRLPGPTPTPGAVPGAGGGRPRGRDRAAGRRWPMVHQPPHP
jgi:hypothetical protein